MAAVATEVAIAPRVEGRGFAQLEIEGDPEAIDFDQRFICTSNDLAGYRIVRPLGVVRGVVVRSRNIVAGIGAGLKTLVGGEITTWTTLCDQARKQALARMLEQAVERGANGIVAIRYDTNKILPGMTEVVAYGMAVSDQAAPPEIADAAAAGARELVHTNVVTTANELPGYSPQRCLGVVQGLTVRSRNVFANIGAGFKSMVGGEIKTYTTMCEQARQEAYERMVAEAVERGADCIVGMRYDTNEVADGVTEVLAYGSAVSSASVFTRELVDPASTLPLGTSIGQHLVTTANALPGMQHSLGMVRGVTVRSSNVFSSIGAGLKNIVGGEIKTWSMMCEKTRKEAMARMLAQAVQIGAKGVVGMRYDTNQLSPGVTEVIAYGTAVSDVPPSGEPEIGEEGIARRRVCTSNDLPGDDAQLCLGTARGLSVRSCNLLRSFGAGLKTIVGGEIRNWTALCEEARDEAFSRMLAQAAALGATGLVGVRYDTNDLAPGVIEVLCYGTAVVEKPREALALVESAPGGSATGGLDRSLVSTSNEILGSSIEGSLGVVRGITVRSRSIGMNIGASLKTLVGGEIQTWTKVCEDAREEALQRMLKEAEALGAKAVVALRYETNDISEGVTEVLAYGTAVSG